MSDPVGTVDVVVVGSGAAGLTAALTAARAGLQTLVVEKADLIGGTSAYSGACLWLPGNDVLRRAGVDDPVEHAVEYLRATVGARTPAALQEAYARTAPELVAFLEQDPHLRFERLPFPDYFAAPGRAEPAGRGITPSPLPGRELGDRLPRLRPTVSADQFGLPVERDLLVGGQALVGRLLLALDAAGVEVRTATALRRLLQRDGRVVGVEVGTPGGGAPQTVHARSGVVVAAGGYEADAARRREWHGLPGAAWTSAAPGSNTGDAVVALQAVGADLDLLDEAWWCPATLFPNGHAAFTLGLRGGIFVNDAGERFANESLPYDRMGHAMRDEHRRGRLAGHAVWWVFDSRFTSAPALCEPVPDAAQLRAAGLWHTRDDLAGLAAAVAVPSDALARTVTRFNGFAATGHDADHGRGEDAYDRFFASGDGPNPCLVPIDQGPFHAVRVVLGDLGSKGGARTDADARVLDRTGAPIPGLHAVGNSAASVAGHVYPGPGVPLGSGMVFGYRAARALAEVAVRASTPAGHSPR